MENTNHVPAAVGVRRDLFTDPVKAQGILASVTVKERNAARLWPLRWGFLSHTRDLEEEEALKVGLSLEEYKRAMQAAGYNPVHTRDSVQSTPTIEQLPKTSSGMIGRRVRYPLEIYGPLVKTGRHYPTRPPLAPGQVYDPYKQTMVFLGSVEGDPISHKQSPARSEVTDEMWAEPHQLTVTHINFDDLLLSHSQSTTRI